MASLDPWFLADPARFRHEREELEALAARSVWLTLGAWRLDASDIVLEFDIDIGHRVYEAVLRFPETYPHSPAVIRPRDEHARWSVHQFRASGDLCLQIRPDNWSPDLMGWKLVDSAYQLLSGESPAPDVRAEVPSAHRVTEGQQLRTAGSRLLLTRTIESRLETLEHGQSVSGRTVFSFLSDSVVRVITMLERPDQPDWDDPEVPGALKVEMYVGRAYIRRLAEAELLPRTASYAEFESDATNLGWPLEADLLVAMDDAGIHAYSAFSERVHEVTIIRAHEEARSRLSEETATLADKRVAIVGCGSLGSKVATMLARTGVGAFILIDDDILEPDNLVRHDLDWRDVGHHKIAALSHRLQRVRALVDISTHTRQVGGQESGTSAATVLMRLAASDLIIDATANPAVANILSGFAQANSLPVVWSEVFAGGVGGLVARCRPGTEPPLPLMRRAIENWFAERGTSAGPAAGPYEADVEGPPLVADDADVTVIAAHAARMAIDLLIRPDASRFPWSAYVVGMATCDLFAEPFEVHPIALPKPPPAEPKSKLTREEMVDENNFIRQLIKRSTGRA